VTRQIARLLARYAVNGLPRSRPSTEGLILQELDHIPGNAEALVWALGCAWAIRVEWRLTRGQPFVNCALLMAGLYVTVNFLVPHLAWYGIKQYLPEGLDASARGLARLGIYLVLIVILTLSLTGRRTQRLFGAVMFPFLALLGFAAHAVGTHAADLLQIFMGDPFVDLALRGPLFGVSAALLLALPAVLLYRGLATPLAVLAVIPAIAREAWIAPEHYAGVHLFASPMPHAWRFVCFVFFMVTFATLLQRWLRNIPESDSDLLGE
jgi:hypothetical protein